MQETGTSPKAAVFLTAEWNNLAMFNYAVDRSLLDPYVPAATELDAFEGRTLMSLVAFEFNNTRLAGMAIPFHRSFAEVNLRFYVKHAGKRGVVFIRELVPKRAVAAVARFAFGENYSCVPMSHRVSALPEDGRVKAEFFWGSGEQRCSMRIETQGESYVPVDGSLSQFISEHYWGYAMRRGGCLEYEVQHPRWQVREAKSAQFFGDATSYYGNSLGQLLANPPHSAFLAEGSSVTVFKGSKIQ
jgi:uncharacterized protein